MITYFFNEFGTYYGSSRDLHKQNQQRFKKNDMNSKDTQPKLTSPVNIHRSNQFNIKRNTNLLM